MRTCWRCCCKFFFSPGNFSSRKNFVNRIFLHIDLRKNFRSEIFFPNSLPPRASEIPHTPHTDGNREISTTPKISLYISADPGFHGKPVTGQIPITGRIPVTGQVLTRGRTPNFEESPEFSDVKYRSSDGNDMPKKGVLFDLRVYWSIHYEIGHPKGSIKVFFRDRIMQFRQTGGYFEEYQKS